MKGLHIIVLGFLCNIELVIQYVHIYSKYGNYLKNEATHTHYYSYHI